MANKMNETKAKKKKNTIIYTTTIKMNTKKKMIFIFQPLFLTFFFFFCVCSTMFFAFNHSFGPEMTPNYLVGCCCHSMLGIHSLLFNTHSLLVFRNCAVTNCSEIFFSFMFLNNKASVACWLIFSFARNNQF